MTSVEVFVDGACKNNGHNNPQAGCGVFWAPDHQLNVSERLKGDRQTNNRAELSAAIIGVTQAIENGINDITVTTDSKYVKNGITQWIKEWKINKWKTTKKGDVLNKDLWWMLDELQGKLTVNWRWVEGHKDTEGNIQADDLAKAGIAEESCFWQDTAYSWYEGNCAKVEATDVRKMLSPACPQVYNSSSGKDTGHPEYICRSCNSTCKEKDQAIQCQDCKYWVHYKCSDLPEYQLYLYESTQRRYTCKYCVTIDEDFTRKFLDKQNLSAQETVIQPHEADTSKVEIIFTPTVIKADKGTDTTGIPFIRKEDQVSVYCQTEDTLWLTDLQDFKKSTVESLQNSFVGAFDQINNSVRDIKNGLAEDCDQKQRILNLTKEVEKLRAENKEKLSERKCHSCEDLTCKVDKLNRVLDKEKEKSQSNIHNLSIEKELQVSKLKADISLLNHRIEGLTKQLSTQESEMSVLERRLESKNQLIEDLEEKSSGMIKRISELQDEVLSWKLSSCKGDEDSSIGAVSRKGNKTCESYEPKGNRLENDVTTPIEDSTREGKEETTKESSNSNVENKNTSNRDRLTNNLLKKTVRIVGTSNIKSISPAYIGGTEFSVSKITRYTLKDTMDYFSKLTPEDKQDVFILQSLCNDIKTKSPEYCSDGMADIVDTISSKYKDSKVIVSLGLPRSDEKILNTKTEKTNILIKEKFAGGEQVTVCDNGNLFYRGEAQRGVLNEDGIHLSGSGTNKLAKNLKGALFDAFDIPWVVYATKMEAKKTEQHDIQYSARSNRDYTHTGNKRRNWKGRHGQNDTRRQQEFVYEDRPMTYREDREFHGQYYPREHTMDTHRRYRDWLNGDLEYRGQPDDSRYQRQRYREREENHGYRRQSESYYNKHYGDSEDNEQAYQRQLNKSHHPRYYH